jgi:two-component system phosphate regulon sensor histidine kinase PhoR
MNHFAFGDTSDFVFSPSHRPFPPASPIFRRNIPRRPGQMQQRREQINISVFKSQQQKTVRDTIIAINPDSLGKLYEQGLHRFDSIMSHWARTDSASQISQEFRNRAVKLRRVARKTVQEVWRGDRELPADTLSKALTTELQNRNVPIAFELGVIRDSIILSKTNAADTTLLKISQYKTNLHPNDFFRKNTQLAVYFPDKDFFIVKTLNWLLIMSLLFSLAIIATFGIGVFLVLKQKKISEMKSDFINNMTHEFKTPIATISVATDSIVNQKIIENPDKIRYFVEMIKKENRRMNRQVEDILTIARLDKKEFEFNWEVFDLHGVIENAIQSIVLQVEKKGGTIKSELIAANPVATSDPTHFSNLIYNLLDNANKYSPGIPEITIKTTNTGKGILISVSDKGIGMNKAVQSRIFERFYRQTSGNVHNVKGFGLGLSYVKAVLEANKGTISVHSEPGKGSTFEVFIPFVRD